MRRHPWWVVPAAAAFVLLPGCGGGSSGSAGASGSATSAPKAPAAKFQDHTGSQQVTVKAVDNNFVDQFVTVKKGTTVTFTNDGRNIHDIVPVTSKDFTEIETGDFGPGQSGTVTFSKAGEYSYYCSLHGTPTKGMYGAIKVVG